MNLKSIQLSLMTVAVQKKLRDIQLNPRQGIQSLLDLSEFFSSDHSHDDILDEIKSHLADENSAYYQLIKRLTKEVSAENLTAFGINLAYQSFNSGKKEIRKTKEREGFHVPWNLFIDAGGDGQSLSPALLSRLFAEGHALGLRTYMIDVAPSYPALPSLLSSLRAAEECAFVLFLAPESVTRESMPALAKTHNLLAMLDLDAADTESLQTAAQRLLRNGRLCGGFARYDQLQAAASARLAQAAALGLPILMLRDNDFGQPVSESSNLAYLEDLRKNLSAPLFPIDLYQDAARIDRAISDVAVLTAVLPDGSVAFNDERAGYRVADGSISEQSLKALFKTGPQH